MNAKAASLLRVMSLSSSRSVWFRVKVPPVLVKLLPTASLVFCRLIAAPLIVMPSAKVNVPPVEEIIVPVVISGVPKIVKSAFCVAKVP